MAEGDRTNKSTDLSGLRPSTVSEGADPRKPLLAKGVAVGTETKIEERRPDIVPERSR